MIERRKAMKYERMWDIAAKVLVTVTSVAIIGLFGWAWAFPTAYVKTAKYETKIGEVEKRIEETKATCLERIEKVCTAMEAKIDKQGEKLDRLIEMQLRAAQRGKGK